jgi:hypothetical protein
VSSRQGIIGDAPIPWWQHAALTHDRRDVVEELRVAEYTCAPISRRLHQLLPTAELPRSILGQVLRSDFSGGRPRPGIEWCDDLVYSGERCRASKPRRIDRLCHEVGVKIVSITSRSGLRWTEFRLNIHY